jgi:enamine deaminase RidA (YjgF/YER057c/UK114 family)
MKILTACLLVVLANHAAAAQPVPREHLAPRGWEGSYHQLHYSPVVKIGDRVIVSGIPALEGDTEEAKIRWMFDQLKLHLEAAGASMEDVVELTSFHVATSHEDFRERMEPVLKVHREFFKDHYPAWTAVGTTALFSAEAPMELRAEAIIGSARAARAEIAQPASP